MNFVENNDETELSNEILIRLGALKTTTQKSQIMIKCLNPGHIDHSPSMSVNMVHGICHCFACGFKGSLKSIYYTTFGRSIYNDLGIQRRMQFKSFSNKDESIDFDKSPEVDFIFKGKLEPIDYNEKSLAWMNKRGFTVDFCKNNNIYYCDSFSTFKESDPTNAKEKRYYHDCAIIPIFENNRLISFEARDVLGKEAWEKYMLSKGKDLEKIFYKKVLYPKNSSINTLYEFEKLDKSKPLYITEGLMDLLSLRTYESEGDNPLKNSSCMFHCQPTERQIYLLKKFKSIIYVVNNDLPGLNGCKTLMERIPNKVSFLQPPTRPNIKDVNDILQGKDPILKTMQDLVSRGWLSKTNDSIDDLMKIIEMIGEAKNS